MWDHVLGVSMAVRLKDIARDLGVSVVTVSKVLRGNADIGEATRRRVLKRMKELNYQPNMMARGLASGRTHAVGLVVPDLVHPFFAEFAKSLSGVLRTSDRALILASSEEDPEVEKQEIRTLLSRGGVFLFTPPSREPRRIFKNCGCHAQGGAGVGRIGVSLALDSRARRRKKRGAFSYRPLW